MKRLNILEPISIMPVSDKKTLFIKGLSFRLVRNLYEKEGFPTCLPDRQARFTCGNDRTLVLSGLFLKWLLFCFLLMLAAGAGTVFGGNKHECSYCHVTMHAADTMLLKSAPSGLCLECHPDRSGSKDHKVDIEPSTNAGGLPLNKEGKITCVTCHDPHAKSGQPMLLRAAQSELCVKCHLK